MKQNRTASPAAQLSADVVRSVVKQSSSDYLEVNYVPSDGSLILEFEELSNSQVLVFHISPQGIVTDHQVVTIDQDGTVNASRSGAGGGVWTGIRARGVRVFEEAV